MDDPRYDFAIARVQAGPSMCSICCELARVMKVWLKIALAIVTYDFCARIIFKIY